KCLKSTHEIVKITDLMTTSLRLDNHQLHRQSPFCDCADCRQDRLNGCLDPHKCATRAKLIIESMTPKFNTLLHPQTDNLTLTHRRKEKNTSNRNENKGEITFDP
ncbi:hypothetical protein BJ138DRAFT_978601, partial [Hygrophoropsis aurantiaca]